MKKLTCIFLLAFLLSTFLAKAQDKTSTKIFENTFENKTESFAGFRLEPPFDNFKGRSKSIQTQFQYNNQNIENASQLSIRINVDELKTGLAITDKYFKEVFMHTKLYPEVVFTLDSIRNLSALNFENSNILTGNFHGKLFYHGVSRTVVLPVSLKHQPADEKSLSESINILSEFEINLTDYNVIVPENLKNRIGEKATLFISTTCYEKIY